MVSLRLRGNPAAALMRLWRISSSGPFGSSDFPTAAWKRPELSVSVSG